MENDKPAKPQTPNAVKTPTPVAAAEPKPGSFLVWISLALLLAGYLALWKGSTVAAPLLIVLGYFLLGLGILWS